MKSNPQYPNWKDNVGTSHQGNASGFSLHASSLLFFDYMSELSLHSFISCQFSSKASGNLEDFFLRIVGFILLMHVLFIWTFMKENSINSHSGQVLTLNDKSLLTETSLSTQQLITYSLLPSRHWTPFNNCNSVQCFATVLPLKHQIVKYFKYAILPWPPNMLGCQLE